MALVPSPTTRLFRASELSPASIEIQETQVTISSDPSKFIAIDEKGIYVRGPTSEINLGPQRRRAGLFIEEFDLLRIIPKTIVTPFPLNYLSPPLHVAPNFQMDMALFAANLR